MFCFGYGWAAWRRANVYLVGIVMVSTRVALSRI
jgi:hypothetical protein